MGARKVIAKKTLREWGVVGNGAILLEMDFSDGEFLHSFFYFEILVDFPPKLAAIGLLVSGQVPMR